MKSVPIIVVQLIHIFGPMKGEIQEFTGESISIGRDPSCDLRFPADLAVVSRKHVRIIREGNLFRLIDSSSNGTYVNGKRVKEISLRNGDVLEFAMGGPKVSFLSEIREGHVEDPITPPVAPQKEYKEEPAAQPVQDLVKEYKQPEKAEQVQKEIVQPEIAQPEHVPVQKVRAPLVIQYGPTLRSYRELPVTIGRNPECDFILDHPSINDLHARIFFSQDQYWIEDLTGQKALRINQHPVDIRSPLGVNDEISMSAQGPRFRFLGDGRLAEIEEIPAEGPASGEETEEEPHEVAGEKLSGKLFSRFRKYLKH